ncbi:MAG: N-acetyltransferase family protein [Acidimicrobiia bacterium]
MAVPADLPRLAALAELGVAEQADARGGAVWAVREARTLPAEASLTDDLASPSTLVLAGTIDDVVVGYLVVRTETLRDGTVLGRVSDVFVEPDARDVSVGEALVDRALAWCDERGCRGVDAVVLPGNRATKNFFETMGFTARAITVHRSR